VYGLSGNIRVQNFPVLRVALANIIRVASISRSLIQPASIAFNPKDPKLRVSPFVAILLHIPLNCFLYFNLFGANIYIHEIIDRSILLRLHIQILSVQGQLQSPRLRELSKLGPYPENTFHDARSLPHLYDLPIVL